MVDAQAQEGLVDLLRSFLFGAAVELGHHKRFLAVIALAQGFADEQFAAAFVVIPGVIEKGDAAVERGVNELDGLVVGQLGFADVGTAESDGGDFNAGGAELAVEHFAAQDPGVGDAGDVGGGVGLRGGEELGAERGGGARGLRLLGLGCGGARGG